MTTLRVKNWDQFQHYTKRTPPWIKLHRTLLDDYAFGKLSGSSKGHLMLIWLLASHSDGEIPNDPEWVGTRIGAREPVDLQALIDAGFLEDTLATRKQAASKPLAPRKQSAMPETETETETEKRQRQKKTEGYSESFERLWAAYPARPNPNKAQAHRAYLARLREGVDPEALQQGVERYARYVRLAKVEPKFVKMAQTFLSADRHWETPWTVEGQGRPAPPAAPYHAKYVPIHERLAPVPDTDPRVTALVRGIGGAL